MKTPALSGSVRGFFMKATSRQWSGRAAKNPRWTFIYHSDWNIYDITVERVQLFLKAESPHISSGWNLIH